MNNDYKQQQRLQTKKQTHFISKMQRDQTDKYIEREIKKTTNTKAIL
jgi:hypothetical protein